MPSATVDDRGRILLPAHVRDALDLKAGDEVLLEAVDFGSIRLPPAYQITKIREVRRG